MRLVSRHCAGEKEAGVPGGRKGMICGDDTGRLPGFNDARKPGWLLVLCCAYLDSCRGRDRGRTVFACGFLPGRVDGGLGRRSAREGGMDLGDGSPDGGRFLPVSRPRYSSAFTANLSAFRW